VKRLGILSARYTCALALLAACSVYELPTQQSEIVGGGGNSGSSSGGEGANSGTETGGVGSASGTGGKLPDSGGTEAGGTSGAAGSEAMGGFASGAGGEGGADAAPDECPDDPAKVAPGACGCGLVDADCVTLEQKLVHRYDFEGSGTAVQDRVGTAHGVIARGATLSKLNGRGVVLLGGGSAGAYVDLPNGLASALTNATFEAWITWGGGASWQRVFDFGDSTNAPPENNPASGKTYIFVTPRSAYNVAMLGYSTDGNSMGQEVAVRGTSNMTLELSQVVAVADASGDKLQLYVNGVKTGELAWTGSLSAINDVNVWLGRSQYVGDPELSAVYHDFRVYGAALTSSEIATSYRGGPDPAFLAK
jgi:hypothetical protein